MTSDTTRHDGVAPVDADAPTSGDGRRPTRKNIALLVIAMAQLLIVLDATIVSIALPSAQRDLGISDASRQWVVTAYTLAFGGLLLLGGRIADYAGRRRTLVVGLLGFAAASALGGLANTAVLLFLARGLQGAFAALLAPAALSLLAVTFTGQKERARAFAVFGAIGAAGGAFGLLAGGLLTEYLSWRWCLGIGTPIAVVTAGVALAVLTESRTDGRSRYDVAGAATVTGGLVALVYAFTTVETDGWSAPLTLTLFTVAAALLAGFLVVEARSAAPLLPLRVLRDRNRGGAYLVGLMLGAALLAFFLFLTFYLQQTLGYSALRSGVAFLPFTVGIGAGAVASSVLSPRLRPGPVIAVGLLVAAAGMALLTRIDVDSGYASSVLPPVVMIALGIGLTFGPVSSTALIGVADEDAGVGSAMVNTTQQVGGSIGTALLNTIFSSAVAGYLADRADASPTAATLARAAVHGYSVAFWVAAAILTASAVLALLLITATREQAAAAAEKAGPTGS